jgi:peptidoglycan/xylan/chitin deacetylase (PgdA/CDA1 family)
MDREKWQRMEDILDKYGVKPLVGIIPANADPKTMIDPEDVGFWEKALFWEKKGWSIALHGYDHVCISDGGMSGLNPFWKRSEFAGLPLEQQRDKIKKGYDIFKENGFEPKYFFAPSHTFDDNTLVALREETPIRIISDTIALVPYKKGDFTFIPQISGHCVEFPFPGEYTFCFHPNIMSDDAYTNLESFLKEHAEEFVSFDELERYENKSRRLVDILFSWVFFRYRKLRGLS